MIPEQLESACLELFGESWKSAMVDALGIDASTRWRYLQRAEVPGPVHAAVVAWLYLSRTMRIGPPDTPDGPFRFVLAENPAEGFSEELDSIEAAAALLFGKKWKRPLCKALGIDTSTLWRQMNAPEPPGPIVAAIRAWLLIKRLAGLSPPFEVDSYTQVPLPVEEQAYRHLPVAAKTRKSPKYARLLTEPEEPSND